MIRVLLYEHVGTALVVPAPTGVVYQQQAGGVCCLQPELEGFLVPLGNDVELDGHRLISAENELFTEFASGGEALDSESADRLDAYLQRYARSHYLPMRSIRVNRERLHESFEAWVHVVVSEGEPSVPILGASWPLHAVLTWNNSD